MLLVAAALAPAQLDAQDPPRPEEGEALAVYLLTAEPGDQVWELFGHNALLVRNTRTGAQAVYHYGLFDFGSPGFVPRFLKGEMMYWSGRGDPDLFLRSYEAANRKVWAQELNLTPPERARVLEILETAVLPENRYYRYEYFLNNCSTKLRDVIDAATEGRLAEVTRSLESGATWRTHTRRLTGPSPWYGGFQLLLGPRGDERTTVWQEMWVPMKVRDVVAGMTITRDRGVQEPLVASESLWTGSDRPPEPAAPPRVWGWFLLAGVTLAGALAALGSSARSGGWPARATATTAFGAWTVCCGLLGLLLVAVHWTDHEFMYWNQNALLFAPLGLVLAPAAVRSLRRGDATPWAGRLAGASAGLAAVAALLWLLPWTRQGNGEWILFALPVHFAVWFTFSRTLDRPALPELP